MDDLVNVLVGPSSRVDTAVDTPISSVPGTPALGQPISLPGPPSVLSGRLSRNSDAASDRYSLGTTLIQSQNGATENVMDRCVHTMGSTRGCAEIVCVFLREMTARVIPDLIDIEQELFELPQKVRCYMPGVRRIVVHFWEYRNV